MISTVYPFDCILQSYEGSRKGWVEILKPVPLKVTRTLPYLLLKGQ